MNKQLLLAAVSLFTGLSYSQKISPGHREAEKCSQHHRMQEMKAADPQRFATVVRGSAEPLKSKHSSGSVEKTGTIYVIPVVFHVIHQNGSENISAAQIEDQMNILNRDYRRLNADANQVQAVFQGMPTDAEIQFKLATVAPNGACFSGITRTVSSTTNSNGAGDIQVDAVIAGNNVYQGIWPHNKYLNVYVANQLIDGAAGYTFHPNGNSAATADNMYYNGIFMLHDYVGSTGTSNVGASRALTHEVGHWLNLSHTWGDEGQPGDAGNCTDSDFVQDTPTCIGVTSCNLNANTCSTDDAYWGSAMKDNVENYMDYSYCSKMFTQGQVTRMRTAIISSVGGRSNIWTTANLQAVGAMGGTSLCALDFSADQTGFCAGGTTTFTPNTTTGIATYSWSFPGGTPSSSTAANPTITYSTPGTYNVTLVVTSTANGTSYTKAKTSYIGVGNAGTPVALPFNEGFASTTFPPVGWTVTSASGQPWVRSSTVGLAPTAGNSLRFNNFDYNETENDEIRVRPVDLSQMESATLTFDVAYRPYSATYSDGLEVLISTNCGASFTSAYSKSGTTLSTVSGYSTSSFVPTGVSQWRTETIDLTPYVGQSGVVVMYRNLADNGNNLYIDNININGTAVVPVPSATFTATSSTICAGQTITFTSTSTNNPDSYSWTFPGGTPATSTVSNPTVTYAAAGSYTATLSATNADGTGSTNQSVIVHAVPNVTFGNIPALCIYNNAITLNQGSPAGGTYSGTGVSGNQFNPAVSGTGTHTLTYSYTNLGCSSSATKTVLVDQCLGVDEAGKINVTIFPNPSSGMFKMISEENVSMVNVYDFAGRVVYSVSPMEKTLEIDLSGQAAGIYRIEALTETSVYKTPVIIQK